MLTTIMVTKLERISKMSAIVNLGTTWDNVAKQRKQRIAKRNKRWRNCRCRNWTGHANSKPIPSFSLHATLDSIICRDRGFFDEKVRKNIPSPAQWRWFLDVLAVTGGLTVVHWAFEKWWEVCRKHQYDQYVTVCHGMSTFTKHLIHLDTKTTSLGMSARWTEKWIFQSGRRWSFSFCASLCCPRCRTVQPCTGQAHPFKHM